MVISLVFQVLNGTIRIKNWIVNYMNNMGASEIYLPTLHPRALIPSMNAIFVENKSVWVKLKFNFLAI